MNLTYVPGLFKGNHEAILWKSDMEKIEKAQRELARMGNGSTETPASPAAAPAAETTMAGRAIVCAADVPFSLTEVSGSADEAFSNRLGEQVMGCLDLAPDYGQAECNHRTRAAMGAMREIRARDGLEGMIAAQMVAAQSAGLTFLSRAMRGNRVEHGRRYGRLATDLMELFLRQTEALQQLRGRERRSVQVRHERVDKEGRTSVSAEHEQIK